MRVEGARADIWRVDQFRSREFLGLELVRKRFGRPYALSLSRGSSNETYHVSLDLLATIPSRGLRRRLTDRGRDLNRRLTKSFRLPPASPQDSFSAVAGGRCPDSLPSQNAPSGAPGVMESDRLFILFNFRFAQRISLRVELNVRSTGSMPSAPRCAHASAARDLPPLSKGLPSLLSKLTK